MKYFKVTAQLEKVSTLKDRSVRVTFDTTELDAAKTADLFGMRNDVGHLIFAKPNTTIEIPSEVPKGIPDSITKSQRLRAVIYRWWEAEGRHGTSEQFYNTKMEFFINTVKQILSDAS